jgi:peptidyl-prolyl cis-trans isomerase SurA
VIKLITMRKIILLLFAVFIITVLPKAQTLFTYGNNAVEVKEFLRAYNKVNAAPATNKEKSIREYLELFINSKLKIREAYERGYDTLATFKDELYALRNQVTENYMNDTASFNALLKEAFTRSQKDIRVGHIFIPYKTVNGVSDSAIAKLKIAEAQMQLKAGKSFEETAVKYSQDPSVNINKGDLGYITVFTLPYEFENIIYKTASGKVSAPYKSKSGYHIFKNLGERKALGKIKASQILLAIPPGSPNSEKEKIRLLADSIYGQLLKGADFAKMAAQFSNDYISAASDGRMPDFVTGTYDPVFENVIFGLSKDGAISKPFFTSHGYHIVKRNGITPVATSLNNKAAADELKSRLEKDPRMNVTRERMYNRIVSAAGFKRLPYPDQQLWLYADSVLDFKQPRVAFSINNSTPLFKLGDKVKTVNDFLTYAMTNRQITGGAGVKSHAQVMEEFKRQVAFEYFREHLEDYNADFRNQMNDFKEGNLFFDIMMKNVWSVAQNDTAGQRNYFNLNKNKYKWQNSADAVVFYSSDEQTAQQLMESVKKNLSAWRDEIQKFGDRSTVDSGRYEISKIPGTKKVIPRAGMVTGIEKNTDDNSAAFSYIINVYTNPSQKTFEEARSDVISDYQNELEIKWLAELKRKYPVKVNEAVLKKIIK